MTELASPEGDHLALLKIYTAFEEAGKTQEWCQEKLLNYRSLIR
jgi:HrpA-like RNA helicase